MDLSTIWDLYRQSQIDYKKKHEHDDKGVSSDGDEVRRS